MAIQSRDSFSSLSPGENLSLHTGEVGATWTKHPVTASGYDWILSDSGRIYIPTLNSYTASSAAQYLASVGAAANDHDVYFLWHPITHPEDSDVGVIFQYDPTINSGYRLSYLSYSGYRRWSLTKITNGTVANISNEGDWGNSPVLGTDQAILIRCRAAGITVLFDNVIRLTSADRTYVANRRAGVYGLGSGVGANTSGYHIGLFVIADVGEAVVSDAVAGPDTHRLASVPGNWSNTATWGGEAAPGVGDDVTIEAAVTLDQNATIGVSGGNGTAALTINATGSLTLAINTTLRVRGDIIVSGTANVDPLTNVRISMLAGSSIIFDSTLAPAGTKYRLQMGTAHGQTPLLRARGTSGSPCTFKSDTTGGAGSAYYYDPQLIGQGNIDAEYLNVLDFGDATHLAWAPWMGTNDFNYFRLDHCNFTRCGDIHGISGMTGGGVFIINQTRFNFSAGTDCLYLSAGTTITTGARSLTYSVFDKRIVMFGPRDFTIHHCVFHDVWTMTAQPWATFHDNFFRDTTQPGFSILGNVSNCYYLEDSNDGNPHGFSSPLDQDLTVDHVVIESVAGGGGDLMFPSNPASPRVSTYLNCLLIPSVGLDPAYGASPGKLVSMLGGANTTCRVRHCTYVVNDQESGVQTGESYQGHVGMLDDFSSNLAWTPLGMPQGWKYFRVATAFQDALRASDADYNWGYNLMAGSAGKGYHATNNTTPLFSTGTAGVHDGSGDPDFVDPDRNVAAWAVSRGSAATTAALRRQDAIAFLSADPNLITDLITYVRNGFAPTNPALQSASKDSASPTTDALGTPGAVAFASVSTFLTPQNIYIFDSFDGLSDVFMVNRTGQTGATWTHNPAIVTPGGQEVWRVTGTGRAFLRIEGYQEAMVLASGVPGASEYDIHLSWIVVNGSTGDNLQGVSFKGSESVNSGWRVVYGGYNQRWELVSVNSGVPTTVGTYPDPLPDGALRTLRIEVRDGPTKIRVLVNGVEALTSNSTYAPGNRIGLYGSGSNPSTTTDGIHFGEIAVGSPGFTLPLYEVSGPGNGPPEFDSTDFKVTLVPGSNPGTITITPSSSGTTGTFNPSSVTITNADRTKTFTYRPSSPGASKITFSNVNGQINASDVDYMAVYKGPTREQDWANNMQGFSISHPYVAGPTNPDGTGGYSLDIPGTEHYDNALCEYEFQRYAIRKNMAKQDYNAEVEAAMVRFRNRAVLALGSPGTGDGQETEGVPLYHRYITGSAYHYYNTGDPLDLEVVRVLANDSEFSYDSAAFIEANSHVGVQREMAFWLATLVDRAWMGKGEHVNLNASSRVCLNHVQQWTAGPAKTYGVWVKPFMGALTARALMMFWDRFHGSSDTARAALCAEIPGRLKDLADYIWSDCFIRAGVVSTVEGQPWDKGSIRYRDKAADDPLVALIPNLVVQSVSSARRVFRGPASLSTQDQYYKNGGISRTLNGVTDGNLIANYTGATREFTISESYVLQWDIAPGDVFDVFASGMEYNVGNGPSPDLNLMLFPLFAWVYWYYRRVAGNFEVAKKYRAMGFEIFDGCSHCWSQPDKQKSWNQSAMISIMGLDWLDRGDNEWPDATSLTLQAPASGLSAAPGALSGPFRLSLPYRSKVSLPEPLTPIVAGGGGTLSGPAPILTSDRPFALFAYTPAVGDNTKSLPVSVSGPTLGSAGPVSLAVGTQSTPDPSVTSYTLTGPTTGFVGSQSSPFSITLGSGLVTGTIRFTPQASTGAGTFSPTFVDLTDSFRTGTFRFTPASPGLRTITTPDNAGLTDPPGINYTANSVVSNVTFYTLEGPGGGLINQASSAFTITLGSGTATGIIRFTPQASTGTGLFIPTFVDLTDNTRSGMFVFLPSSLGQRVISTPDNAGLTDPGGLSYNVTAPDVAIPRIEEQFISLDSVVGFVTSHGRVFIIPATKE